MLVRWAAIKTQIIGQWIMPKQAEWAAYPVAPNVIFIRIDALLKLVCQGSQLVLITLPGKHRVL